MNKTEVLNLWPGSGNELQFVNGESFDKTELLNKLGWGGITQKTTTDPEEIQTRQDGLKLGVGSRAFRSIPKMELSEPTLSGRYFFEENQSGSNFNKRAKMLIHRLDQAVKSEKIKLSTNTYQEIVSTLEDRAREAWAIEDRVVEIVKKEMENVYEYRGVVSITSAFDGSNSRISHQEVYGVQDYAFAKNEPWYVKFSRWVNSLYGNHDLSSNWLYILLVLARIAVLPLFILTSIVTAIADSNAVGSMFTKEIPYKVKDVLQGVHVAFVKKMRESAEEIEKNLFNQIVFVDSGKGKVYLQELISVTCEFDFVLTPSSGFRARITDCTFSFDKRIFMKDFRHVDDVDVFAFTNYVFDRGQGSVYSWFKAMVFNRKAKKLSHEMAKKRLKRPLELALDKAIVETKQWFSKEGSTATKEEYLAIMDEVKYSNVHRAIKGLGLEEEWQKVITFRKYLREVKGEIGHVVRIASVINNTRKKFGIPICFPEIVDDSKNIVSFNSLMPFHLLGRPNKSRSANLGFRDLKPIKGLPALNGQIISITGQNGGGKTVVEVELIHALYLAHMGFPVFAEHFTMNAKDTIAMVFVEKGEGSMLQLLMQKLANVAKVVDENPGNKVVVIIDELLTGTQEDAGFSIGKRYLKMLSESNCSTMFVTQITGLAEFARNELGALCFYFDKKGNLQTGIGKGNAEVLAEEVGLSQYLSSN